MYPLPYSSYLELQIFQLMGYAFWKPTLGRKSDEIRPSLEDKTELLAGHSSDFKINPVESNSNILQNSTKEMEESNDKHSGI